MKKWILFSVLILLLIAGGVVFYILSQPTKDSLSKDFKEQAATKILGRKAQFEAKTVKTGNVLYDGHYIAFEYPAKAEIYNYKDPSVTSDRTTLETLSLDLHEPRVVLNMAVNQNTGTTNSVKDLSGVNFREASKGTYIGEDVTVSGHTGRVYEKRDSSSSEKTVFFLVNGKIYTISMTGDLDEARRVYEIIINSLKFIP